MSTVNAHVIRQVGFPLQEYLWKQINAQVNDAILEQVSWCIRDQVWDQISRSIFHNDDGNAISTQIMLQVGYRIELYKKVIS
jgi:hypothetical protein